MSESNSLRVLVTAGNTQTPIDRVRCITNIFTGKTGASIAVEGMRRGHLVTVLTSHPEVIEHIAPGSHVHKYRTFEDLAKLMETELTQSKYDVLIHAAAVSDYTFAGAFAPDPVTGALKDVLAAKIKSHHAEMWLKLVQTPKLADKVRDPWGFVGVFVKFKLEVDISDDDLLRIAERGRLQSRADIMVANTLEGMHSKAYIGTHEGNYHLTDRQQLPSRLWDQISAMII